MILRTLLLASVIILMSCEEDTTSIGDPYNIGGNLNNVKQLTIPATFDSTLIDSAEFNEKFGIITDYITAGNMDGAFSNIIIHTSNIFPDDSILSIDTAYFRIRSDYAYGKNPGGSYEFLVYSLVEETTTDTIKTMYNQFDDFSYISALASPEPIGSFFYNTDKADSIDANGAIYDNITFSIPLPPDSILRWQADDNWFKKGFLIKPNFTDDFFASFAGFVLINDSNAATIEITSDFVNASGDTISYPDSSVYTITDFMVFHGEQPQATNETFVLASYQQVDHYLRFDFDASIFDPKAIIVGASIKLFTDQDNSAFPFSRPATSLVTEPMIFNTEGDSLEFPDFASLYALGEWNSEQEMVEFTNASTSNFGPSVMQLQLNAKVASPDSVFYDGFKIRKPASDLLQDLSYIRFYNSSAFDPDKRPLLEVFYVVPGGGKYE
jgi:hypothetical protein